MRTVIVVAVVALLIAGGAAAVPVFAGVGPAQEDPTPTAVAPGERLMGVVGVTDVEMTAEVEERRFGLAIANVTGDPGAIAELVAERVPNVSDRLATIEERLTALRDAREAGTISEGRFRAQVAQLEAQRRSLERALEMSVNATAGLPEGELAARGVNRTALEQLRSQARDLGGPDVSQLARSLAGPNLGDPPGQRPNMSELVGKGIDASIDRIGERGEADQAVAEAERLVERASRQVDRTQRLIDQRGGGEVAIDRLDAATESLQTAETTLASAREALDAGNRTAALDRAVTAAEAAGEAIVTAEEALEAIRGPPDDPPGRGPPDDR